MNRGFGVCATVVFVLVACGIAQSATINVPVDHSTIQAAIDAANPAGGDTITVAAGTYTENIVINKPVILQGAGRDTTTIDATAAVAVIAVNILNPGGSVTFDGFTVKAKGIEYPTHTFAMNVVSNTAASTITVTNSKFEGTGDPLNYEVGVYVHGTSAAFVFQHNIVTKGGGNPILVENNPGATDVSYNTLDAGSYGMSCFYMTYGGTNVTTLQKFSNNTFDMGTGEAFDIDHAVQAVSFTGAFRSTLGAGGYSNIEIKNNRIYNGKAYCRGIGLFNASTNGTDGLISGALIENNIIQGIGAATASAGIRLAGLLTGITVQNNTISGMADGILGMVGPYGSHYPSGVTLSSNGLSGNGLAINWPAAATLLNAENNWWGDVTGPNDPVGTTETDGVDCYDVEQMKNADGAGDPVTENVDYCPWLGLDPTVNILKLNVSNDSNDPVYMQPGEKVVFDMDALNLAQHVFGCQAVLNFSSTYFIATQTGPGSPIVTPGGGIWDELIYSIWNAGGDLDVAVGVDMQSAVGTKEDGTVVKFTLTAADTDGTTKMVFRADGEDPYLTAFGDSMGQFIYPGSKIASQDIVIDGTDPTAVTISADPVSWTTLNSVTLTFSATDALSGIDHYELSIDSGAYSTQTSSYVLDVSELADGTHTATVKAIDKAGNEATASTSFYIDHTPPTDVVITANPTSWTTADAVTLTFSADGALSGIDHYELSIDSGAYSTQTSSYVLDVSAFADGTHTAMVKAIDKAGNEATASTTIYIDHTNPLIEIVSAKQGGPELIPSGTAVQSVVNIQVTASDATSLLSGQPIVTVTPNVGSPESAAFVDESPSGTFNYTWSVSSTTPNGTATINASVSDVAGNSENAGSQTFNVNKNQITGQVQLEDFVGGTRAVSFSINGAAPVAKTLTFTGDTAPYVLTGVPDVVTTLSAKTAWNLRKRLSFALDEDGQAVANFENLLGGDLNNSNTVNILDYSILKRFWYTTNPIADITGNGSVSMPDYLRLQANFFKTGSPQ